MSIVRVVVAVLALVIVAPAQAANGFDPQQLFFGAGISRNDIPRSDTGTGYQLFSGYRFGEIARNIQLDAEVGYMDSGGMNVAPFGARARANGLWASGVMRFVVNPQTELLARAGLDFGDDDGLLVGVGAGFYLNRQVQMRLEHVQRDNVDSLQVNFTFKP